MLEVDELLEEVLVSVEELDDELLESDGFVSASLILASISASRAFISLNTASALAMLSAVT